MTTKKILMILGGLVATCICVSVIAFAGLYYYAEQQVADMPNLYDEEAKAATDINNALAAAQAEGKHVLIDFGADWCPDCHSLAAFFEEPQLSTFIDENYVIVHVNVGMWDANLDVAERYGNPIENGIPAIVIVDADENIITTTADGQMATASRATSDDILLFLETWAPTN